MAAVWLIAGSTASGKSALALDLARREGGEIVNADSMQVYRDLQVLTARPTAEDEASVPHHLYGVADGAEAWSVGRWLRAAQAVLDEIAARGRPAIVVGGTGLYLRALTHGLAETPAVPDEVRARMAIRMELKGEGFFRTMLASVDPEAEARIAPGDRQRLIRAAAVFQASGRPLSTWRADTHPVLSPGAWRGLVIELPRDELYARIEARVDFMLAQGAVSEVETLLARDLARDLPIMKALGVRELGTFVRQEASSAQAAAALKQQTRRFAKRQGTWFRNQAPDLPRIMSREEVGPTGMTTVNQTA